MKVAIIACAKQEELYIQEWINWNLLIGIDHIFIADNNDDDYNKPLIPIIQDYIINDKVTVLNYNNIHPIQPICYAEIYNKYSYDYDWFYICDVDEFLHIPETNDNIKNFINLVKFKTFDSISINWRNYDDNDLVYYDNRCVQERFTRLANTRLVKNGERKITKAIFKSKKYNSSFEVNHQHDPLSKNCKCKRCNVLGNRRQKNTNDNYGDYNDKYKCAYIAHYEQKTLEEYYWKINRGDTYKNKEDVNYPYKLCKFWGLNNKTEEKLKLYNKIKNNEYMLYM